MRRRRLRHQDDRHSRRLARLLQEGGLPVQAAERGFTAGHQLWLRPALVGVDARVAAERLYQAGVRVNVRYEDAGRTSDDVARVAEVADPPRRMRHTAGVLSVRGLRKRFGQLQVLRGVDLEVGADELVALVGENGAGKSTVVKCIARAVAADAGGVLINGAPLGATLADVHAQGVSVVWQDLALCDNLDVVANLFLGREHGRFALANAVMDAEARQLLDQLGVHLGDLYRPVATLSGGQRQAVALARAMMEPPRLLILDEPTAALGVSETRAVEQLIRRLRDQGVAVLLISQRIEQVCNLADRIVVLREGRIVADVSPLEVHPDDVVALMSGIQIESTARRQLQRLRSLVDQLSEVAPSASLPLIVSAMAAAIGQEQLCVHLLDPSADPPVLRRSAALGVPEPLLGVNKEMPVGKHGGSVGLAAATGAVEVIDDVREHPAWAPYRDAARAAGILSSWAAPIVGTGGVLGTISGYAGTPGRPQQDTIELIGLYTSYAAAAIEREALQTSRQEAEALRRSRDLQREFLERLSHELRTPLTTIEGYASTLLEPDVTWDEASRQRFLNSIAIGSARLGRLVGDLLDASAIESGTFGLHPDWCELDLVLDAAVACVTTDGQVIDVRCEAGLGPVWADHDRLEQVFVNLIGNAARHTPPGTRIDVHAAPGSDAGTVVVRVADDGPGIPPALVGQIFAPHVHGATPSAGTGLGLTIAQAIVDAHGGWITLETVPVGTSILVTLPTEPAEGLRTDDDG
ncbi:MAG: ATP-binding cassette domain-containing protein [Egibacteraceae bacterium]